MKQVLWPCLLLVFLILAPGCNDAQMPGTTEDEAAHAVDGEEAEFVEPHMMSSAQWSTHIPSPTAIQVEIRDTAILQPGQEGNSRHAITCRVGVVNTSSWPEYIDKTLFSGSALVGAPEGADRQVPDAAGPPQGFGVFASRNVRDDIIYLRPGEFWGREIRIAVTPDAVCDIAASYESDGASLKNIALSAEGVVLWTGGSSKSVSVEVEDGLIVSQ